MIGKTVSHYRIIEKLGGGGMGVVYKARDSHLDRFVAIKVLPPERVTDPMRKARFVQEAKAASALNHPNIITVHDIDRQDGVDFIVMEHIAGKTLDEVIPRKGLKLGDALKYSVQISDALSRAHAAGIIHRDLKPANIMVDEYGQVKVLDFGLAKLTEAAPPGKDESTRTTLTIDQGIIVGTVAYMSPEQAEGKQLDARSDIFSFGSVMYEMLTGKRAFQKQSTSSTLGAIIHEEPEPLGAEIPQEISRIIARCLRKDPAHRFQHMDDVKVALEELKEESESGKLSIIPVVEPTRWRHRLLMAFATIAVAVLAFAAGRLLLPPSAKTWAGRRLGGPEMALGPRISPDGHTLAFQAIVGQNTQVAVMKPESGNWQVLTRKSNAGWVNEISWSPDGNMIYYDRFADVPLGIYSVPALGGDERPVLENAFAPEALPDGSLLVVKVNEERKFQVFRFWPDGRLQGFPVELGSSIGTASVIDSTLIRASRDGREAFAVGQRMGQPDKALHLYLIDLVSGGVHRVVTGLPDDSEISALAPSDDGSAILAAVQSSELVRIVAFPKRGSALPRTLLTLTAALMYLDSGPDGSIYADQWAGTRVLLRFARERGKAEKIGFLSGSQSVRMTALHDGRIGVISTLGDSSRLLIVEAEKQPITLVNVKETLAPPLTPVGSGEVAFMVGSKSDRSVALASTANGQITRRIRFDKGPVSSLAASPDGKTIYCAAGGTVWLIPQEGEPRRICAGDQVATEPGGRSLLVKLVETPKVRLLRVPLDGAPPHEIMLTGPLHPSWHPLTSASISADGQMIAPLASPDSWFYIPGIIDLETGKMTRVPLDYFGDYFFLAWAAGGQIVAAVNDYSLSVWRFSLEH